MPTYDFRCKHCGHRFEITRSITEDGTPECPTCGEAANVVKVFPRVGISFKGSGFYKTDSRGSSKSASQASSSESSSSSDSSSSASSSSAGSGDSSSGSGSSGSGSAAAAASGSGSTSTASTAKAS